MWVRLNGKYINTGKFACIIDDGNQLLLEADSEYVISLHGEERAAMLKWLDGWHVDNMLPGKETILMAQPAQQPELVNAGDVEEESQ